MRISVRFGAQRGHRRLGSAVTSNRVSGCRTVLMNRRTQPVSGSLAPLSRGCILKMTASQESIRTAAVATFCWPESRPTWACAPECMFGSAWTGTLHIPQVHCSCLSVVISVLELRSSFGCTFKEGGTMKTRRITLLVLLGSIVVVPVAQAQVKHIEMRVEGMT